MELIPLREIRESTILSKVLTILGNIKGSSTKGEKIAGDRLVYDTNSKLMTHY